MDAAGRDYKTGLFLVKELLRLGGTELRAAGFLRLVVVPPIEQALGFLKGIDTDVEREEQDRL